MMIHMAGDQGYKKRRHKHKAGRAVSFSTHKGQYQRGQREDHTA